MRISFFGKGGSGKTTAAAMMAKYLTSRKQEVLAIDADINVDLSEMLDLRPEPIGDRLADLAKMLEPNEQNKHFIGSTPPTSKTRFIRPSLTDEFFKKFAETRENLGLLRVGSYDDKTVGSSCYHSKLGSIVFVYNRLLDDENFWVITDSTAGVDTVGTNIFAVSDVNLFIVEPTKKGVKVFLDFLEITKDHQLKTYVLLNKIQSPEDEKFVRAQIPDKYIIGQIKESKQLKRFEQGEAAALDEFVKENQAVCEKIESLTKSTKRNWQEYYARHRQIYLNDAKEWYSQYFGEDLETYLEPDFNYEEYLDA
ncbi:MAG: AAA family ATPase [Candidatus Saccharibacteria bacterium]|nr:AAA family ATPase [Candidatus Saccharibacteria bacterium]